MALQVMPLQARPALRQAIKRTAWREYHTARHFFRTHALKLAWAATIAVLAYVVPLRAAEIAGHHAQPFKACGAVRG